MNLLIQSQTDIATRHDAMLGGFNDSGTANQRWSKYHHYLAINYALTVMSPKLVLPHVYTVTNGWAFGTYEYTLPTYMEGPIEPQFLAGDTSQDIVYPDSSSPQEWITFSRYEVNPTSTEGRTLRLGTNPKSTSGRIIWWAPNSQVPTPTTSPFTLPTITADMTATSTSVTTNNTHIAGKSGYVKVDNEWMFYAGTTPTATAMTLSNLVRGVFGTTAATHDGTGTPATITWGVAVPSQDWWNWLYYLSGVFLHMLPLNFTTSIERDHHEFQLRFLQKQADDLAGTLRVARNKKLRLRGGRF